MASVWTPIAAGKIVTHASERLDHGANPHGAPGMSQLRKSSRVVTLTIAS